MSKQLKNAVWEVVQIFLALAVIPWGPTLFSWWIDADIQLVVLSLLWALSFYLWIIYRIRRGANDRPAE